MVVADTSFLYALFNDDDEHNLRSLLDFERLKDEKILVPDRVLEELFGITTYKKGIGHAFLTLDKISSNRSFLVYYIGAEEQEAIFQLARVERKRLSFVDYAAVYLARRNKERLLCFDRQLSGLLR